MEQDNDVETVETQGEATTDVLPSSQMLVIEDTPGTFSHDGRYIQYNIDECIFEVTAKYKPLVRLIGRGASGIVCSAVNSETNEKVAIKKISHAFRHPVEAKRTLREIKLLRHFNHGHGHGHIVGIRDVILPPERDSFEDVYIVYELMEYDLLGVMTGCQDLSKEHCTFFLYQILCGLKYIHSANVLHRDLKPSNLLLNANCDLKICDFGLARAIPENGFMSNYVVTRWYRAPELLLGSSDYTAAIDVWSVGCIFMEMMICEPLFPGDNQAQQLRFIVELIGTPSEEELGPYSENAKRIIRSLPKFPRQSLSERFPNVPPLAIDLVEKMLTFDPRERISVKEALAHPCLSPYHDLREEPECMVPFEFELDDRPFTEEQIREFIYCEALAFNPELQQ